MGRSSGLEKEVIKILGHIFMAFPAPVQAGIVAVIFSVIGVVCYVNREPDKIVVQEPAVEDVPYFDDKDPERTFRWLIAAYGPVEKVADSLSRYKGSNPLRTERDAELEKAQAEYAVIVGAKVGTRILWPVIVNEINMNDIKIKNSFKRVKQNGIWSDVYLRYEEFPFGRESYTIAGKLKIGTAITLEQAKQLDVGEWLFVDGEIKSIRGSSIDVVDCHAVLAAPQELR